MRKAAYFIFLFCAATLFSAGHSAGAAMSSSRMDIVGDKLYIAGIGYGFHVFDISDPWHPKWAGGWQNHTCPVGVQVMENFAYLANRTSGFDVIDVHNSSAPVLAGHLTIGGDLQSVQIAGHYAYVADLQRGLDIIDVADPTRPRLVGDFATKGQGWSAVASGDHAYVSYGTGVLRTFRLENGINPQPVGESADMGGMALQITGDKLLTQHAGTLCLMDISDPTIPIIRTDSHIHFSLFWSAWIRDSLAFVTEGNMGLGIFDFGVTGKIRLLGSVQAAYQGFGVGIHGNVAYVVDGGSNLHIFDVSNPARPVEVNRVGAESFCSQVLSLAHYIGRKSSTTVIDDEAVITNAPPKLVAIGLINDGRFSFTLHGVPESSYDVQASIDLIHWTTIGTATLPSTGFSTIIDPDARLFANRYYRTVKKP